MTNHNFTGQPMLSKKEKKLENKIFFGITKRETKKMVWIDQRIISGETEEPINEHWRDF